jgi:hypothetical protein
MLHGKDTDLSTGANSADGVSHMQASPLLSNYDGANVGLGGSLDDGVDRITDQELNAFTLENLGDGSGSFHDS